MQWKIEDRWFKIDKKTNTPKNAIIFITICCYLSLLVNKLEKSTLIANLTTIIIFIFINLPNIILRFKDKNIERPFKVPLNIGNVPIPSVIGLICNLYLCYVITFDNYLEL